MIVLKLFRRFGLHRVQVRYPNLLRLLSEKK